jgi:hypothetical protein
MLASTFSKNSPDSGVSVAGRRRLGVRCRGDAVARHGLRGATGILPSTQVSRAGSASTASKRAVTTRMSNQKWRSSVLQWRCTRARASASKPSTTTRTTGKTSENAEIMSAMLRPETSPLRWTRSR